MENQTYKGWLTSQSLVKRSLAVVGHYLLGQLIIMAVLVIPVVTVILITIFATRG